MIVPRVYERQRELRESLGVPPRSRSRTKMKQNSVLAFRLRGSRLSTNENSVGALCSRVLVDSCRGRHAESKERRKGKKEERERESKKRISAFRSRRSRVLSYLFDKSERSLTDRRGKQTQTPSPLLLPSPLLPRNYVDVRRVILIF